MSQKLLKNTQNSLDDTHDSTQQFIDSPSPSDGPLSKRSRKKSKITIWDLIRDKPNRTSLYVLYVLLVTYMFNQVDRYLQAITAEDMQKDQGWGDKKGGGYQEDILVGAVFTVVYLPAGIPMGYLADLFPNKKKYFLSIALSVWSLAVIATGFTKNYYQIMIFRFILAIAESACTPLAGSIISDYFSKETRTTALGIYNWGIYTGYSLALGVANALTELTSWRTVWWVFGFAGLEWSLFILLIPKSYKKKQKQKQKQKHIQQKQKQQQNNNSNKIKLSSIIIFFLSTPSLVILLLASLIRNAGGYVWAYNAANFFKNVDNQSDVQQATFMQFIPLIGGCFGSLLGGFISDRYVKKSEPWKRLLILVISNVTAAPFALLALILPAPYCYLMLIPSNVIGEMWVGICLALIIDIVPNKMKTTSLSVYFFFIGLAGFFPLLVTPLQTVFCNINNESHSCNTGLQWALIILFPGLYVLSSLIFLASMIFLKRDRQKVKQQHSVRLH